MRGGRPDPRSGRERRPTVASVTPSVPRGVPRSGHRSATTVRRFGRDAAPALSYLVVERRKRWQALLTGPSARRNRPGRPRQCGACCWSSWAGCSPWTTWGRIDLRPPGLYPASNAVDGDLTTRWSSAFDDPQWITIDLGSVRDLAGEAFLGGGLCPCLPDRQGLDPRPDFSSAVREVTNGDGGVDDHEVQATGRYVRMTATERATPYGDSLWEFEVLGPACPCPREDRRPARSPRAKGAHSGFLHWLSSFGRGGDSMVY